MMWGGVGRVTEGTIISRGFLFRSLQVRLRTNCNVDEQKYDVDEFHNLGFRRVVFVECFFVVGHLLT